MKCQRCKSDLVFVMAKCDDRCCIQYKDQERVDYAPSDINLGGGDTLDFSYCPHCGQLSGEFPINVNLE